MEQKTFEISFGEAQENNFCINQKTNNYKEKNLQKGELLSIIGSVIFFVFIYIFAVSFFQIFTSASPIPAVSLLM